jgi:hypothetical protein
MSSYKDEERNNLEMQLKTVMEKLGTFQNALIEAYDLDQKFKLKKDIERLEEQRGLLEKQLQQLHRETGEAFGLNWKQARNMLLEKIQDLELIEDIDEEIGLMHRVNVDRKTYIQQIDDFFIGHSNIAQFYYITSCGTQKPTSLAERTIYEIIEEELEDEDEALYYERDQKQRIKIYNLPVTTNLRRSQKKIKSHITKYLELEGTKGLDQLIKEDWENMIFDRVVFAFKLTEGNWYSHLPELFQWIKSLFDVSEEAEPRFFFFFVFFMDDLHKKERPTQQAILKEIEKLTHLPHASIHLTRLSPVMASDFKDWLQSISSINNSRIDELLMSLLKRMTHEELAQFKSQEEGEEGWRALLEHIRFNMEDIEELQNIICDEYEKNFTL